MQKTLLIGLAIMVVAFLMRFIRLEASPPRLTVDEMSIGYNAYSLIKTGQDEWGQSFPLIFRAFGDYKLPAYIYATVPFVWALGLSAIAIRLPSVIIGTLIVAAGGYLSFLLTRNKAIGLITAAVLAVSPWSVHISRMGLESNLALLLYLTGFVCFIKHQTTPTLKYLVITGLLWGATSYTYIAYRVIIALLILGLLLHKHFRRTALQLALIVTLTALPLAGHLLDASGTARARQISIFSDQGYISAINEDRTFCFLSRLPGVNHLCAALTNKPLSWTTAFFENYFAFLSPTLLFITGSSHTYLHIPGFGEFYLFLLPFYLLGLIHWFTQKNRFLYLVTLAYVIAPIPSALTGEPQIVRGTPLLPFVAFWCALGLHTAAIYTKKHLPNRKRTVATGLITTIACISVLQYGLNLLVIYPQQFDDALYPVSADLGHYLAAAANRYDHVYFDNVGPGLHVYLAYTTRMDPTRYRQEIVWPPPDTIGFTHPRRLGTYELINRDERTLQTIVCGATPRLAYIGRKEPTLPATQSFTNSSNVHVQAQLFDIDLIRNQLITENQLATYCQTNPLR